MASANPDHPDYECPRCGNNAFPCGCLKTPSMEEEVDIAIGDLRAKRFDPYHHFREGKLTIWVAEDGPKLARWTRRDGRAIHAILPTGEQELYQALLQQRLAARKLSLAT